MSKHTGPMKPYPLLLCRSGEVIRMKIQKLLAVALLLIGVLSGVALANGTPSPLGIMPSPNPTPLAVNIWMGKSVYTVGEAAQIMFSVNRPAFIYIYDIQPNGIVRLIFPNAYSHNNYVSGNTHVLPDGNYRLLISPPTGVEQLQIIASMTPLNLAPTRYSEPFPQIGPDPQSAGNTIRGHIMGINPNPNCQPCGTWATAWTSFTIVPVYVYQPGYCPPPVPPCYGCIPGGNWYWYNGQWHYGTPPTGSGWYWYFGPDGRWHFTIRIHIGGN